ncbi:MAG: universal stress protein [Lewinellaceae bacterium]|nr:universal stress protein [Lewinellaceae bacterium]
MKKILVPTDFSAAAANAFLYAQQLARHWQEAEIKVIHAYQPVMDAVNPYWQAPSPEYVSMKEGTLERFVGRHRIQNPPDSNTLVKEVIIRKQLLMGYASEEIVQLSKEYDLIIMSTSGESNLLRRFFGSVSTHVARYANCPVLLIPPDATFTGIAKIVFATDHQPQDPSLIPRLLEMPFIKAQNLHIVHADNGESANFVADHYLCTLARSVNNDLECQTINLQSDSVWEALETYVQEHDIDLVAMGTLHRNLLEQLLHHSTTRDLVLHATTPMLVMHNVDHV